MSFLLRSKSAALSLFNFVLICYASLTLATASESRDIARWLTSIVSATTAAERWQQFVSSSSAWTTAQYESFDRTATDRFDIDHAFAWRMVRLERHYPGISASCALLTQHIRNHLLKEDAPEEFQFSEIISACGLFDGASAAIKALRPKPADRIKPDFPIIARPLTKTGGWLARVPKDIDGWFDASLVMSAQTCLWLHRCQAHQTTATAPQRVPEWGLIGIAMPTSISLEGTPWSSIDDFELSLIFKIALSGTYDRMAAATLERELHAAQRVIHQRRWVLDYIARRKESRAIDWIEQWYPYWRYETSAEWGDRAAISIALIGDEKARSTILKWSKNDDRWIRVYALSGMELLLRDPLIHNRLIEMRDSDPISMVQSGAKYVLDFAK